MMKHNSSSRNEYKLSSDSSTSSSPFPVCFPSPPPSIASFASSISANSSFSSTSSTSSKSNDPTFQPNNLELRFTNLSSRIENILDHDNSQQRPTPSPPVPPVRHKRLQKLLQENSLSKIENHDASKLSPIPAPRTSCNVVSPVHHHSNGDSQSHQQWRSSSPPLSKAPVVSVGQYWTYQRQKQLHKQTKLAPTSYFPERLYKSPKVTIKVYAQTLCQDVEYITLPIDNQTKSSQVVRMLLKKFRLRHRDPNLFYITLERWIKKDGIPVKSVMILGNDACPALLQSCCSNPPHNDIRFTLLMKNGALVKIYCSDVVSDSLYKSLSLSTQTTVEETIELLMNCLNLHHNLGSDTSSQSRDSDTASLTSKSSRSSTADQFELIEVCEATNYKRVLRNDEYLLEVHQSLVNDLDSINCINSDTDHDNRYSTLNRDSDKSSIVHHQNASAAKAEVIIKLVRKEEQQLKSYDRLQKLNGQLTVDNSPDATFKVSNFRIYHNSWSTKPEGNHQSRHHHRHFTPHYNHQQNNRLAHYNYRHYSQEQLIDDLDKLSLILDDDKEKISVCDSGSNVRINFNHYEQARKNSGFTQAWKNDRDSNNNNIDILSHKVVLDVESPTINEIVGLTTIKSNNDDDLDRICPVAPIKNPRNIFRNGIELYENISLNEKINDNDPSVGQQNNFNVDCNRDTNTDNNNNSKDNDLISAATDNSKMSSTKDSFANDQENSNTSMTGSLSKGHDVTNKQVLMVYQPYIYCSTDEFKQPPNANAYENLSDETAPIVPTVSTTPPIVVPRSLYNLSTIGN